MSSDPPTQRGRPSRGVTSDPNKAAASDPSRGVTSDPNRAVTSDPSRGVTSDPHIDAGQAGALLATHAPIEAGQAGALLATQRGL